MTLGPQRIRGVTFDLDDTLYDNGPVLERAEQAVQTWLEQHYPRLADRYDVHALRELRRSLAREEPALGHDLSSLRKRAIAVAAQELGYGAEVGEAAFHVFWETRNRVALFEDVLPVLAGLREAYTLGAITNGNADVTRIGLGGVFHFALSAADVGAAKPAPPLFLEALRRIGGAPQATVHVGDDAVADVGGACGAGLRTVWVNRHGRAWEGEVTPDAEVRSLWELPAVIARIEGALD